jgi:hypothetical protein
VCALFSQGKGIFYVMFRYFLMLYLPLKAEITSLPEASAVNILSKG